MTAAAPAEALSLTPVSTSRRPHAARDARGLRAELVEMIPELYARALRLCSERAAAEDIVQDAVERALRFESQYRRGTNLRAWMFQILFSVFVTRWRRHRRERRALQNLAADPCAWTVPCGFGQPDTGDGVITSSTRRKLESLPEGFRRAVVLVDIEQRSYRDTARELGVPVGTVMSRLHRARKLLQPLLASAEEAGGCRTVPSSRSGGELEGSGGRSPRNRTNASTAYRRCRP